MIPLKKHTLRMLFSMCVVVNLSFSQPIVESQRGIEVQIAQLIQAKYGEGYRCTITMFNDKVAQCRNLTIQDPFSTLKDCVLFSTYRYLPDSEVSPDTFIIGMMKNNQIIWDNFPGDTKNLSDNFLDGRILYSQDLNNDGTVDLVYDEFRREVPSDREGSETIIHILSWNGSQGRFISESMVGSGWPELIDSDADGILEIRVELVTEIELSSIESKSSAFPFVTYGWNGEKYGLWPTIRQVPPNEFLPANRFDAFVTCRAMNEGSALTYSYTIANQNASRQKIEHIHIVHKDNNFTTSAPLGWGADMSAFIESIYFFRESGDTLHILNPGRMLAGFGVTSKALPTITQYYLLSNYPFPCCPTEQEQRDNILKNSVAGFTIGPRDSGLFLGAMQMCDTLQMFTVRSRELGWISDDSTSKKYHEYFVEAELNITANNSSSARMVLQRVLTEINADSANGIMSARLSSEAYALLRYNTEYLLQLLPVGAPNVPVKLIDSDGNFISDGTLQYYEGGWKNATNNLNGTFSVATALKSLSLRMTYAFGNQTKSNITVGSDTIVFRTMKVRVRLMDSQGLPLDTGSVQYYAGAWRSFGLTSSGVAAKELLPGTYSFRMTYASASRDKQQDVGANSAVDFQTIKATVMLFNSQNIPVDLGMVQYYAGAWRNFGATSNGMIAKELLPNSYSFRMINEGISMDMVQDLAMNHEVRFSTVQCTVQVMDSLNQAVNAVEVSFYAGAWQVMGTTNVNGEVTKELLPVNLSMRIKYGSKQQDIVQNLKVNPVVLFTLQP